MSEDLEGKTYSIKSLNEPKTNNETSTSGSLSFKLPTLDQYDSNAKKDTFFSGTSRQALQKELASVVNVEEQAEATRLAREEAVKNLGTKVPSNPSPSDSSSDPISEASASNDMPLEDVIQIEDSDDLDDVHVEEDVPETPDDFADSVESNLSQFEEDVSEDEIDPDLMNSISDQFEEDSLKSVESMSRHLPLSKQSNAPKVTALSEEEVSLDNTPYEEDVKLPEYKLPDSMKASPIREGNRLKPETRTKQKTPQPAQPVKREPLRPRPQSQPQPQHQPLTRLSKQSNKPLLHADAEDVSDDLGMVEELTSVLDPSGILNKRRVLKQHQEDDEVIVATSKPRMPEPDRPVEEDLAEMNNFLSASVARLKLDSEESSSEPTRKTETSAPTKPQDSVKSITQSIPLPKNLKFQTFIYDEKLSFNALFSSTVSENNIGSFIKRIFKSKPKKVSCFGFPSVDFTRRSVTLLEFLQLIHILHINKIQSRVLYKDKTMSLFISKAEYDKYVSVVSGMFRNLIKDLSEV